MSTDRSADTSPAWFTNCASCRMKPSGWSSRSITPTHKRSASTCLRWLTRRRSMVSLSLTWYGVSKTRLTASSVPHFSPGATRKGNEPLETWLLRLLTPKIHFRFHELALDGMPVVLLEIGRAFRHPLRFQTEEFIRIGAVKKPLKEAPDRERNLWRIFDQTPFEDLIAIERASAAEVLRLLDYPTYFDLLEQPLPTDRDGILKALTDDSLIHPCEAGGWNITNLGAILFAKRLGTSDPCDARPCGLSSTAARDAPRLCGNKRMARDTPVVLPD